MNRKFVYAVAILVIVAVIIRVVILGGSSFVSLSSAPALSGTISQSLVTTNPSHSSSFMPVVNRDYSIKSVKYLGDWAVVSLGQKNSSDTATFVMHKVDGFYEGVLGPGTAFSISSTITLPAEVLSYLKTAGVLIYAPSGGQ